MKKKKQHWSAHATRCEETDTDEKISTAILLKWMGYQDGDTPEKQLQRYFTGESYEQQKQNAEARKRAVRDRIRAAVFDNN